MAETNGNGNGRLKIDPFLLLQIVAYVAIVSLAWGSLNARIDALQTKHDELRQDVIEMRTDIKQILRAVK